MLAVRSTGVATGWTWTRCWLAGDPASRRAILVDPATTDDGERLKVSRMTEGWIVEAVVLTHGHPDHICDADYWSGRLHAPIAGHPDDIPLFTDPDVNGSHLFGREVRIRGLDTLLADGAVITAGEATFSVIHLPGHSPGSIGLLCPGHLFSGDTLFEGSIGVDSIPGVGRLWGASLDREIESIRTRLFPLPGETVVHPGHGPDTTIERERLENPFARP